MFKRLNKAIVCSMMKTRYATSRMIELFLMLLAFWWSFVLFLPTSTFASSVAYTPMLAIAGEPTWAIYFFLIGVLQFLGIKTGNYKVVQYGLLASMVTWLFVGSMMLIGAVSSTGAGIYILVASLSASLYFYKGIKQ